MRFVRQEEGASIAKRQSSGPVALIAEYRARARECEHEAIARIDQAVTQNERWSIHAEHVRQRIDLTVELVGRLPLDVAEDQVVGLRKARARFEQESERTGELYYRGNLDLLRRMIVAAEKRLEERKAEVGGAASV